MSSKYSYINISMYGIVYFNVISPFDYKICIFTIDGDDEYDRDVGGYSSEPDPSLLGDTDKVCFMTY